MMILAIGPMISEPGLSLLNAIGNMARAVTSAVIRMDGNRSWAAKVMVSRFQVLPSLSTKYWQCDKSMMLLRTVMPNKVIKPTTEPTDNGAPIKITAAMPPIRAKGRLASVNKA